MPLIQDIKNDIRDAKKIRIPWWGVLLWMAACGLIEWLLIGLGKMDLALPTLNSIAVVGFAIALKRKLGRHAWFWGIMAVIAAFHVPLVLFVPWGSKWVPALAIAALDSLDLCLIFWILAIVGKFMGEQKTAERDHSL
jgi:hypothetical protein